MSVFDWRIEWTRTTDKTIAIPITDCLQASVNKSTEIKNNICNLTLRNSVANFAGSDTATLIGNYVESGTKAIKFDEEDEINIWTAFITDAAEVGTSWYDDARLLGSFSVEEFQLITDEDQTRVTLRAVDTAFLLFNKIYTFSYGVSNEFTAPGIVRNCARKFGEATTGTVTSTFGTHNDTGTSYAINAKFVSEGGYIEDYRRTRDDAGTYTADASTTLSASLTSGATTINVASTTGFESDGTLVIDSEHISYTGVTGTSFTGCSRAIDDTTAAAYGSGTTVYQGFPLILMSKIWKPLFEWVGDLSQTENTNYLSETQEGGSLYFNRAFLFWIDKNNSPHWVYPDNTVDLTVNLGEEGRRAFRLEQAVFDAVNFVIYNAGEDMYGNGILHYWYDVNSEVASLKMRYQPMSKIVHTLIEEDRRLNTARATTNPDIYKQFPSSYSPAIVPSFLDDANKFRALNGDSARTNVATDAAYNDCLREACKQRGLVEAQKITRKRAGLRYRGQIALKGTHINPGDLVNVTNPFVGLESQTLRVIGVSHNINANGWETTLDVEEDEKTVS